MIYVCIPVHNEVRTAGLVLWKVRQVFTAFPREYQLLVCDDASTDGTREMLASYAKVLPMTVITHRERRGYARTLEELLESLDSNLFWRAHRSYLVNINRIKEVVPWFKSSYQLRMDDRKHTEVPVSRVQTRRLRELFKL